MSSALQKRNLPKTPTTSKGFPKGPKSASLNGQVNGAITSASPLSAYEIMAGRIANRVAEMAENFTIVERSKPAAQAPAERKRPRKLEMRLNNSAADSVAFSAPFLDNTLEKMLDLQNRMLKVSHELSKADGLEEAIKKEQFAQSAELSRIIALICAEKARQGA